MAKPINRKENGLCHLSALQNSTDKQYRVEARFYFYSAAVVAMLYLLSRFVLYRLLPHFSQDIVNLIQSTLGFGVNQLQHLFFYWVFLWLSVTVCLVLIAYRKPTILDKILNNILSILNSNFFLRLTLGLLFMLVFFLLRNNTLNPDGQGLLEKIPASVSSVGAHVTHDEILELYIHSRFWHLTKVLFHWDVGFSYQVLSIVTGGFFILLLWNFCSFALPKSPLPYFLLVIMGGYMQLFFGDIENYSLTATLMMGYYLCAVLSMKGRLSIIIPGLLLGLTMMFHLLAGFLLPSFLYLIYLEIKKKRYTSSVLSLAAFFGIILATLVTFDITGILPLSNIFSSHAFGSGGNYLEKLVSPSWQYFWEQVNLLALLFPFYFLIILLVIFDRIKLNNINIFFLIASIFMMILFFFWKAQIGIYNDWNLFSNSAIILSLFTWYNVLSIPHIRQNTALLISFGSISFIHTISWVFSNHLG